MIKGMIQASLLVLFLSTASWGADQPGVSPVPALAPTARGQSVTVLGHDFPAQGVRVSLRTGEAGDKGTPVDATVASDSKSLTFKLPTDHLNARRYLVYIDFASTELAVPGDLVILPDEAGEVEIDSVSPSTVYPSGKDDGYDFAISGKNLGSNPNQNTLEVVGAGAQPVGTLEECKKYADAKIYQNICLSYEPGTGTSKLFVKGFRPGHYQGPVELELNVNGNVSASETVTFAPISETGVRFLATVLSLAIAAIVFGLVRKGIGIYKIGDQSYSPAESFFLDKETNSYSLSKFQLLAWTAVAVFSYVFVFCCRLLIQWNFTFPAVPSGWATLLGLSAGTTVAAVGITASRGSKGAGPVLPSMADFISSGGLVASDRFQFFVWTLVGCAGFLALVLSQDPAKLQDLPVVPDGFLYLMGISATGYLGGKVVRTPGPVVSQLLVTGVVPAAAGGPATMTIDVKGENLSQNALVQVDKDSLRPDQFAIAVVKAQDQAPDPSFCTEINLTLTDAAAYLEGQHTLTLTNKDGQMAESSFPVDLLTIKPGQRFPTGTAPVAVNVIGQNFGDGMTAVWTDQTKASTNIASNQIIKVSATQLKITLTPGPVGSGTLVLISSINLRATASVAVS
jgi:hypothetical protein